MSGQDTRRGSTEQTTSATPRPPRRRDPTGDAVSPACQRPLAANADAHKTRDPSHDPQLPTLLATVAKCR